MDGVIKNIVKLPYSLTVNTLNYIQDKFSSQKGPETYDGVGVEHEKKEEKMNFEEIVLIRGFPLEIHYADTEDGFILKLYRIPGGKNEINYRHKQKQSVFLMHGIFDSSDGWICNDVDKCIPFILANLGYDVWLGNSRGNKHSRHHKIYKDNSPEMWNFSFNEMGMYDLPAFISHILKINKWSKKLIYIGHSQGTTSLFAALTTSLEYFKERIKLFIALAPVARTGGISSKVCNLMRTLKLDLIFQKLQFHEVLSHDEKLVKLNSWIMPKIPFLCNFILHSLGDDNPSLYNNKRMMPVYISHQPGGSSIKAVGHLVQQSRSKKFENYDYGKEGNLKMYGQEKPKEYDISAIKDFPIALFYGEEDKFSTPKDVEWLRDELGDNVVVSKKYNMMGHCTFQMAEDMTWFDDVVELMDLYL